MYSKSPFSRESVYFVKVFVAAADKRKKKSTNFHATVYNFKVTRMLIRRSGFGALPRAPFLAALIRAYL